jgi:hypothetical protein
MSKRYKWTDKHDSNVETRLYMNEAQLQVHKDVAMTNNAWHI